jgi:hypothetical protein
MHGLNLMLMIIVRMCLDQNTYANGYDGLGGTYLHGEVISSPSAEHV